MAPIAKNLSADDDFVLTISDDDQNVPVFDGEEELITENAPKAANGTKRKRDQQDTNGQAPTSKTKNPKRAKLKDATKKTPDQASEDAGPEEQGQTWTAQGEDDGAMNSDFEFQIGDVDNGVTEDFDGWGLEGKGSVAMVNGNKKPVDIDELIARRRKGAQSKEKSNGKSHVEAEPGEVESDTMSENQLEIGSEAEKVVLSEDDDDEALAMDGFGMGATGSDEEEEDDTGQIDSNEDPSDQSHDESIAEPVHHPDDQGSDISAEDDGDDDPEEAARREAFFAPEENVNGSKATNIKLSTSFQNMSLSRPILRGLASVGFSEPTPIQDKTIPMALLGKDVVGGAVTGSGKTAAFIIPILERLLYRPKKVPTSRVAILMPTRELAVQCFNVAKKLASFTDVTFCQLVGGFSLREQESVLRSRPDVIIATPGRFIDHMRNSASFTVDTLEILVLDEADRMLEDGFADELNEILTTIPKSRQTMLFSATMTSSVDKLIRVGLNRPVRLMVDAKKQTVGTLVQEFVRLRPGREDKRLGYLMHLCENVYTDRVIIFFRQKKEAHRIRIIFGLCGLKAAELHGSMSQEQRISAIESFRSSTVSYLLATDVASRGLDIKNVSVVLNYEAPQSHSIYLHRVGRTARAGRFGRSCTIAAEPDRKVIKEIVKSAKTQGANIVSRVVEKEVADAWAEKINALTEEVEEIMSMEREEKQLVQADRDVKKGENLMKFEDEIMGRPKRTWFESEREKRAAKEVGRAELNGVSVGKAKGKLSGKDKKRLDDRRERVEGKVWKKGREERGKGVVRSKVKMGKGKAGVRSSAGKRGGKR